MRGVLTCLLVMAVGAIYPPALGTERSPQAAATERRQSSLKALAVMQFENEGPSVELEPLRHALSHMLASDLAQRGAVVIARQWLSPLVQERILKETGVAGTGGLPPAAVPDFLIGGTYAADGDGIRLKVQVWSAQYGLPQAGLVWEDPARFRKVLFEKSFHGQPDRIRQLEQQVLTFVVDRLGLPVKPPRSRAPRGPITLAVIDLRNFSATGRLDAYQQFYADELTRLLSDRPGIVTVERARIRDVVAELALGLGGLEALDLQGAGHLLGADRIVLSGLLELKGRLRVDAHLVEAASGVIAGVATCEGPAGRADQLLAELAGAIAEAARQAAPQLRTGPAEPDPNLIPGDALAPVPAEARMHHLAAWRYAQQGRDDLVLDAYRRAAYAAPEWITAWAYLAGALAEAGETDEAVDAMYKVHALYLAKGERDKAQKTLFGIWSVYARAERYQDALKLGRELLEKAETREEKIEASKRMAWLECYFGDPAAALDIAEGFAQRGDTDAAFEVYQALLDALRGFDPSSGRWSKRNLHAKWPFKPAKTIALHHRMFELVPSTIDQETVTRLRDLASRLSWSRETQGQTDSKVAALRVLLERVGSHDRLRIETQEAIAQCFDKAHRYREAGQAYADLIADYPSGQQVPLRVYHRLAELYDRHLREPDRAIPVYRAILAYKGLSEHDRDAAIAALRKLGVDVPAPPTPPPPPPPPPVPPATKAITVGVFNWPEAKTVEMLQAWGYGAERFFADVRRDRPLRLAQYDICCIGASCTRTWSDAYLDQFRHYVFTGGRVIMPLSFHCLGHVWPSPRASCRWLLRPFDLSVALGMPTHRREFVAAEFASHPVAQAMPQFLAYRWVRLHVPQSWVVANLAGDPVVAAGDFGLGRVVVLGQGDFHLNAEQYHHSTPRVERESRALSNRQVLAAMLEWAAEPLPPAEQALADRFREALRAEEAGQFQIAARTLEAIWRDQPGSPYGHEARFWLARLLRHAGHEQAAAAHYRALTRAAPHCPQARLAAIALGELAEETGDFGQARRCYARAIAEARDFWWFQAQMRQALCYLKEDEFQKAAAHFRQVVDNQADGDERVRALFGGAYCYEQLGRRCDAARLYRYLAEEFPPRTLLFSRLWDDPFERYVGRDLLTRRGSLRVHEAAQSKLQRLTGGGA